MIGTKEKIIPFNQRYGLNIEEAAQYFCISTTKLREIIHQDPTADYILKNGNKTIIRREKFTKYLEEQMII